MFQQIGFTELLLILAIALLIFGPKKLPELGRSLGKSIREFKQGLKEVGEGLDDNRTDYPSAPEARKAEARKAEEQEAEAREADDQRQQGDSPPGRSA